MSTDLLVNVIDDDRVTQYRQTHAGKLSLTGDATLATEIITALKEGEVTLSSGERIEFDTDAPLFNLVAIAQAHDFKLEHAPSAHTNKTVDEVFAAARGALDWMLVSVPGRAAAGPLPPVAPAQPPFTAQPRGFDPGPQVDSRVDTGPVDRVRYLDTKQPTTGPGTLPRWLGDLDA